jgi:hypothetical protein
MSDWWAKEDERNKDRKDTFTGRSPLTVAIEERNEARAAIARVRELGNEPIPDDSGDRFPESYPEYVRGYMRCFTGVLRALDGPPAEEGVDVLTLF